MPGAIGSNEALYLIMFSGGSLERRRRRLRTIRRRYEARLTDAEAALIEVKSTRAPIDSALAELSAESCMLGGKQGG